MRTQRLLAGFALAPGLALAACGGSGAGEAGPMGADEEQALSQAAEMLDDPRTPEDETVPPEETSEGETREGL